MKKTTSGLKTCDLSCPLMISPKVCVFGTYYVERLVILYKSHKNRCVLKVWYVTQISDFLLILCHNDMGIEGD